MSDFQRFMVAGGDSNLVPSSDGVVVMFDAAQEILNAERGRAAFAEVHHVGVAADLASITKERNELRDILRTVNPSAVERWYLPVAVPSTAESIRADFESFLVRVGGFAVADIIWQAGLSRYADSGMHLAYLSWVDASMPKQVDVPSFAGYREDIRHELQWAFRAAMSSAGVKCSE